MNIENNRTTLFNEQKRKKKKIKYKKENKTKELKYIVLVFQNVSFKFEVDDESMCF